MNCTVMMRLSHPHAIPAQSGFVHRLTKCSKHADQIVAALSYRRVCPGRVGSAVIERGMETRRTGDSVENGAVTAHFRDKLQTFNTGHHLIAAMRRVAAAGVYHILHVQRVAVFVHQFMRTEKLQRLTALLTFMHHGFIADIGGCFFADQADSTQLLFPPFATHLP